VGVSVSACGTHTHTLESRVLWPWRKTVVCLVPCVCGLNFTFLCPALQKSCAISLTDLVPG